MVEEARDAADAGAAKTAVAVVEDPAEGFVSRLVFNFCGHRNFLCAGMRIRWVSCPPAEPLGSFGWGSFRREIEADPAAHFVAEVDEADDGGSGETADLIVPAAHGF